MMMKSGRATSSEVVRMFHAYCGSSLSSGIDRNAQSRLKAVSMSVSPIHRPPARAMNSTPNSVATMLPTGLAPSG
jgi:hypothetical protein